MEALLQIYLRKVGVALPCQHFFTFVKIGVGVCKLFFLCQKTNRASKKVSKISCVLITRFLARFGVYFMVRSSSNENEHATWRD